MESVKSQPLNGLDNSEAQVQDALNNVFSRSRADQGAMTVWYPAVDILESGDAYLIRVELPD
jgi:HSP20 family molecular chaperone IbpA